MLQYGKIRITLHTTYLLNPLKKHWDNKFDVLTAIWGGYNFSVPNFICPFVSWKCLILTHSKLQFHSTITLALPWQKIAGRKPVLDKSRENFKKWQRIRFASFFGLNWPTWNQSDLVFIQANSVQYFRKKNYIHWFWKHQDPRLLFDAGVLLPNCFIMTRIAYERYIVICRPTLAERTLRLGKRAKFYAHLTVICFLIFGLIALDAFKEDFYASPSYPSDNPPKLQVGASNFDM